MPSAREDHLLRLVQQVAAAMRRLRERISGPSGLPNDEADAVAREAGDAIGLLLGPQARLLQRVDAASAAALVGAPERVALWADLLDVQASAVAAAGDEAGARRLAERAAALRAAPGGRAS